MNFGVIIRSIGERTQHLCYDSIRQYIPKKDIHLLQNIYPSYRVYLKMFEIAQEKKYDWALGIDADLVLRPEWWSIAQKEFHQRKNQKIFRLNFAVKDFVTQNTLSRGNHFYNGKYIKYCRKYLKLNLRMGKIGNKNMSKGYLKSLLLRPEFRIRTHMKTNLKVSEKFIKKEIGLHGYEQYYVEIFRQYLVRYYREPEFYKTKGANFLTIESPQELLKNGDIERYVATLAWNTAPSWPIKNIDGRIKKQIASFLELHGIVEKKPLNLTLENFYQNYS